MKKPITYRLYALEWTPRGMEIASSERFSRAAAKPSPYILVYSCDGAPDGAIELTEEDEYRLTVEDRIWLYECQVVVQTEYIANNQDAMRDISERIEALETELKRRKVEYEAREET